MGLLLFFKIVLYNVRFIIIPPYAICVDGKSAADLSNQLSDKLELLFRVCHISGYI